MCVLCCLIRGSFVYIIIGCICACEEESEHDDDVHSRVNTHVMEFLTDSKIGWSSHLSWKVFQLRVDLTWVVVRKKKVKS